MLRRLATLVAIFVTAVGTWAVDGQSTTPASKPQATASNPKKTATSKPATHKAVKGKKKSAQKAEVETPPPPPPPPPTLEQQPAVAPDVSYRGGMLTITARNSTMADVLNAVRRVTGANIERPPGSGTERVVGNFGPGAPKDVLAQLLNGSRYDYIILGSATRPGGVDRLMLTMRANAGPGTAVAAAANPAAQPNNRVAAPAANDEPETEPEADVENETAPETDQQPEPPAAEQQQAQPGQAQPGQAQPPQGYPPRPGEANQQNPNQQNPNQQQVKSPEELLRELQQMQQQQQQQQQQQPPPQ